MPPKKRSLKSLCHISKEFLRFYEKKKSETASFVIVKLQDAADELETPKRRLYDIFNTLQLVGILSKSGVSAFAYHGMENIHTTLLTLQRDALADPILYKGIEKLCESGKYDGRMKECLQYFTNKGDKEVPKPQKKQKALALLSKRLIQLFLVSLEEKISYEDAITVLIPNPGEGSSSSKNRRLYDIANILNSIDLIQRVSTMNGQKKTTSFEWIWRDGFATFRDTRKEFSTNPNASVEELSKLPLRKQVDKVIEHDVAPNKSKDNKQENYIQNSSEQNCIPNSQTKNDLSASLQQNDNSQQQNDNSQQNDNLLKQNSQKHPRNNLPHHSNLPKPSLAEEIQVFHSRKQARIRPQQDMIPLKKRRVMKSLNQPDHHIRNDDQPKRTREPEFYQNNIFKKGQGATKNPLENITNQSTVFQSDQMEK